MPNILRLVIPGLVAFGSAEAGLPTPQAPALQRLLGRATVQPLEASSPEATLFHLFGVPIPIDQDLPVAPVTWLADGGDAGQGWWLRADPVHLRPDFRQVLLFDVRAVMISAPEAQALAAEFNHLFSDENLRLETPHPERWYLRLDTDPGLRTHPLLDAVGRDITPLLPKGLAARRWHNRLNEIQMLFHNSAVNAAREANAEAPINSIWLWGGGALPAGARQPGDSIYADDPLTRGFARLAKVAVSALPDKAADWRDAAQAEMERDSLVVLEAARYAGVDRDYAVWVERINGLERDWFAPCLAMLKDKTLDSLYIYPCNGKVYKVERGDWRQFWRRL